MLILPSPGTLPVIESAGHSGDVGIKPAPAAAITSDSDESSITKCGWSTNGLHMPFGRQVHFIH
jgi:hypothetical protein